jgi:hypothetical protein
MSISTCPIIGFNGTTLPNHINSRELNHSKPIFKSESMTMFKSQSIGQFEVQYPPKPRLPVRGGAPKAATKRPNSIMASIVCKQNSGYFAVVGTKSALTTCHLTSIFPFRL